MYFMSSNQKEENNKLECSQCSYTTDNDHDLYKHKCHKHPKNEVESAWAELKNEGFKSHHGSSFYESFGPWY